MRITPSPGNSISVLLRHPNTAQAFAEVVRVIAESGGGIGPIEVTDCTTRSITRRIAIDTTGGDHPDRIVAALRGLAGIEVLDVYDRTFKLHEGGKLEVVSKVALRDSADLSMAYTPGVARVCQAIHSRPSAARDYTIKRSTVAVLTDGSAVLGLGDIGAVAALPVMEGKAVLFKEFGKVDAFPVCVDTKDPEELLACARAVAATFGGINLEDIAAPKCFEIERRLTDAVDIPVFHDDQHGTAVVVGAAFINAVKLTGKEPSKMRAVISGAGAAGVACTRALYDLGIGDVIVCDRQGSIYRGRQGMNPAKEWLAQVSNAQNFKGTLQEALVGADLFLGVSGPNLLTGDDIRKMAQAPIVFALSNPVPEVAPEAAAEYAAVVATGRSDYPNQINNVLCFPGLFRGLLECGAKRVTREMLTAAARAIASVISEDELRPDFIIPSVFDKRVSESVAGAVVRVASDPSAAQTPIYFDFAASR
ncbi:MAG: NAD-dependent malic enzyme [Armatimonadota bacterium]|nr:NAD-dependent malic enzyme [Armatimonadota bacterium]